jgi:malonate transporter and related proteins
MSLEILNLVLPYFGLIFIGFASGKLKKLPDEGLAWMSFFILYVSLPTLFFRILAKAPFEQLAQWNFIKATMLATASVFGMSLVIGLVAYGGNLAKATLSGVAGGFGNVGYMGPGLALAAIGPDAAVPVALIFCFDALFVFASVPLLMSFGGENASSVGRALRQAAKGICFNPLLIAAGLGSASAAARIELPMAVERLLQLLYTSAAPCALFALGVTVAVRPMTRVSHVLPILVAAKLVIHPIVVVCLLQVFGPFGTAWVNAAILMAALPPALTVYVFARQYDTWIEEASGVVLLGTTLSVVTLTAVMWSIQSGTLPNVLSR